MMPTFNNLHNCPLYETQLGPQRTQQNSIILITHLMSLQLDVKICKRQRALESCTNGREQKRYSFAR